MKIAIMQPYFFPYIGYFQLINAVDKFVLLDDVSYINKGWINRNRILVNKKIYLFTIPLDKASQNRLINQICIKTETHWKDKFLKTIKQTYSKAPFFENIFKLLEEIIYYDEINLVKRIFYSLTLIKKNLNFNTAIIETSQIYDNNYLKGQERIIDICKKENAKIYYNLWGGTKIYSNSAFKNENLQLKFLKTKGIFYKQFDEDFIPDLSFIDVLMFNSVDKIAELLNKYYLFEINDI